DMVLTITELLRRHGVVGKFVEVFGDGLDNLTVPDRATIANMSPEFRCTVTYFPVDDQTLAYLRRTNRAEEHVKFVEEYYKENLLWRTGKEEITYSDIVELDLSTVEPTVAGPKRPQDKILVKNLKTKFQELLQSEFSREYVAEPHRKESAWLSEGGSGTEFTWTNGDNKKLEKPEVVVKDNEMKTIRIMHKNEA